MPVKTGKDSKGCYAQWGGQKKYYYKCSSDTSRKNAKQKAHVQGYAVEQEQKRQTKNESFDPIIDQIAQSLKDDFDAIFEADTVGPRTSVGTSGTVQSGAVGPTARAKGAGMQSGNRAHKELVDIQQKRGEKHRDRSELDRKREDVDKDYEELQKEVDELNKRETSAIRHIR